jgi:hypothetical protein
VAKEQQLDIYLSNETQRNKSKKNLQSFFFMEEDISDKSKEERYIRI